MDISAVVPLFNEVDNVGQLHRALDGILSTTGKSFEIIFVDDGSVDGTEELLCQIAKFNRNVKLVLFRKNAGQTAALAAGLHYAAGDAVVTLDGDGQNDPADIPRMLEKLDEGYDFVHGWRKERQDAFASRRLPSLVANRLTSRLLGIPVHDLGCGLKVMRREVADNLRLYGDLHRFITVLASSKGARCCELVVRHHPRRAGQSKYGLSRTFRVLLDLITVYFLAHHLRCPMRLFGGIGLSCGVLGVAAGLMSAGLPLFALPALPDGFLSLLAVMLLLMSVQFLGLGLLGETAARVFFELRPTELFPVHDRVNFSGPEALSPRTASRSLQSPMIVPMEAAR